MLGNGLIHSANTSTHKVTAKKDTRPRGATRRVIELPRESISRLTLRNEKSMLSRYPCNSSAVLSTKQGDGLLGGRRRPPKGRGRKCRENGDTSASQFRARQSYLLFRSVTIQQIHGSVRTSTLLDSQNIPKQSTGSLLALLAILRELISCKLLQASSCD